MNSQVANYWRAPGQSDGTHDDAKRLEMGLKTP